MNKNEFLEILKDYLRKDFSDDEVNDILRDYEEYFVDGLIEGKSDMEIISALGSPKAIAKELISQIKEKDESKQLKNNKTINHFSDEYKKLKIKAKDKFSKGKSYISEKLTPDLYKKNSKLSTRAIKIVLFLLSLFLLIPAFTFVVTMVCIGITLATSLIVFLVAMPFIIKFVWAVPEITSVVVFASIFIIGCEIIIWQIYLFFIRFFRRLYKQYINWLKTRNIYINASEKKDKNENNDNWEGEDDYE